MPPPGSWDCSPGELPKPGQGLRTVALNLPSPGAQALSQELSAAYPYSHPLRWMMFPFCK